MRLEERAPGIRDEAARRARIMAVVMRHRMAGRTWQEVIASIPVETGLEAPCEGTLISWSKRIDGVDPVNWAPALAPDWRQDGRPKAPCDPEAWDYFEKAIAASGRNGTGPSLRKAHGKAKAEAARRGWTFPNYRTVHRHFRALPAERQRTLLEGADAAAKSLTLFQPRTLDGLAAMEQAEVDFREFPVLCIWEDDKIGCPWVGIAADRASSKIVGRSVARSENEEGVIALTRNMVETHGIPDRMVQDNGSAFNGFRMMGGQVPLVRRKDSGERNPKWAVPGVYEFLGVKVENHGPRMAWAKLPESLNSILRHMDNDPVFHRAQRTGPNDAPNPNPVPVPIALFRAVLDQTIAEINADTESRAKGLHKGECRNAAFQRLSAGRIGRWPTPLQRRWMRLKWDLMTVSNAGQVKRDGLYWGDATTQRVMVNFSGRQVMVGIDPDSPEAPAMVYEWDAGTRKGRLLLESLPRFAEARHNDPASKQRAAAEKKRAKAVAKEHEPQDLPQFVVGMRAQVMASAEVPGATEVPKVTQLPAPGPFSAAGPLHHGPRGPDAASVKARAQQDTILAAIGRGGRKTG